MGFYNMNTGDAPYFKFMAQHYAISDNYHQSIMGGTGANFLALVTGHAGFHNSDGVLSMPPDNVIDNEFGKDITVSQIENPDPQPGLENTNWYTEDGYRGGSYVKCADPSEPGVKAIWDYLDSIKVNPNCEKDTYYLVNNYNLGYTPDGKPVDLSKSPYTLPPQPASLPTIADALSTKGVSWKWYTGGRGADGSKTTSEYCGICDPLIGFTSIITTSLKNNLQDVTEFYKAVKDEAKFPAVAFVRPFESMAGHPANAITSSFENFVTNLINMVKDNQALWEKTAILITTDEGGGYYDSGYIQIVDFFGDGTRIPLIAVSPYAKEGYVDHTYYDGRIS
jgi:phospholipase C